MFRKTSVYVVLILSAVAIIFSMSLWLNIDESEETMFVGTDSTATRVIQSDHTYKPWFSNVFTPGSGEIESGLFSIQAALGGCAFGFAIGALWQRRRELPESCAKTASNQPGRNKSSDAAIRNCEQK